jgi:hypothetical protein
VIIENIKIIQRNRSPNLPLHYKPTAKQSREGKRNSYMRVDRSDFIRLKYPSSLRRRDFYIILFRGVLHTLHLRRRIPVMRE